MIPRPISEKFVWLKDKTREGMKSSDIDRAYKKCWGARANTGLIAKLRRAHEQGLLDRFSTSTEVMRWAKEGIIPKNNPGAAAPEAKGPVPPGVVALLKDLARQMLVANIQKVTVDVSSGEPKFSVSVVREEVFGGSL